MTDGMITRDEEERLRAFRDRLALENSAADPGVLAELDRAGADRVVLEARLAAISFQDGDGRLQDLTISIRQAWPPMRQAGSSSAPGRRPWRAHWKMACCSWTRRTRRFPNSCSETKPMKRCQLGRCPNGTEAANKVATQG